MKPTLLLLAPIFLSLHLSAQNLKGRFLLGASTQIAGNTFTENLAPNQVHAGQASTTILKDGREVGSLDSWSFNISPYVGYFVTDGLALGISTGISGTRFESQQTTDTGESFYAIRRQTLHFAPTLRYCFLPNHKLRPYTEARVLFARTTSKIEYALVNPSTDEDAINASYWGMKAGAAWFLHEKVSLDAFFDLLQGGYTRKDNGPQGGSLRYKTSFWGLGLGVSVYL